MESGLLVVLTGLLVLGFVSQALAWWLKQPAILFLLLTGLVVGPVTGVFDPDAMLGKLLFPVVSVSVAIILFEGSMTLRFSEIKQVRSVIRRLITLGAIVSMALMSLITYWAMNCSWEVALLFGAVTVVTGPTVIVPMLRTVRPNAAVANVLRWEGILIDPIGAIFAVMVYEFVVAGAGELGLVRSLTVFSEIIVTGFMLGAAGGYLMGTVLRRHWLPEYLHNFGALAVVVGLFTLSNQIVEESGLLTVTVMGVFLANMKEVDVEELLDFKESLSLLLISGLFIMLAARLHWQDLGQLGWGAVLVLIGLQMIARPLSVFVSSIGSKLSRNERVMIGWMAPRGIVAAAVSVLFALHLEDKGVAGAGILVPLTFLVIITTVLLQSVTARPIAKLLGVAEPDGHGFLIIGANTLAIAIARELHKHDVRVLLADSSWQNSRTARMEGLPVYFGNALSEHADRHLDLVGLTGLLALSRRNNLNALATMRYRSEFGAANTYALGTSNDQAAEEEVERYQNRSFGRVLFSTSENFYSLDAKLKEGYKISGTQITEEYGLEQWKAQYQDDGIPLFVVSQTGKASPVEAGQSLSPKPGQLLVGMVPDRPTHTHDQ